MKSQVSRKPVSFTVGEKLSVYEVLPNMLKESYPVESRDQSNTTLRK